MIPLMRTLLGCAALAFFSGTAQAQLGDSGWVEAPQVAAISASDRVYGAAKADFSMIVWLDPECPYCKVFGQTPERVVDGSGGKLNLAVRLYPLSFHGPNAVLASAAALCVADQAGAAGFYKFMSGWLALTGGNGKGIAAGEGNLAAATSLAAASGAKNPGAIAACTKTPAIAARIKAEIDDGEQARISGTPAIAVRNNKTGETIMGAGALSQDDLESAVNYLAGRAGADSAAQVASPKT
jgi:protein-disulfide isomerase